MNRIIKKIYLKAFNFVLISLLIIACACQQHSHDKNLIRTDNDLLVLDNDYFFIEEAGSIYLNPIEAISGNYALKGSYRGKTEYSDFLSTNNKTLPLKADTEYEVSFTYKIIKKANKNFEVIFYSDKAAKEEKWLENFEFNGENGEEKEVSFKRKLFNFDDYKVSWNIVNEGAVSVDKISIKKISSGKIIAQLNIAEAVFKIDVSHASIQTKVKNRGSIPIFNAWGTKEKTYDCDTDKTPYSLVWTSIGLPKEIESVKTDLSLDESYRMQKDHNTIYLVSPQWCCWYAEHDILPKTSQFYLDEVFTPHENSEYPKTLVLNFEKEEWHKLLGKKALNYKRAGFDGIMFDWWSDEAGNGRNLERVQKARLNILKSIREKTGDDFILMGNVNWRINDPSSKYLSGAFMELWKEKPSDKYALYKNENPEMSIEKMEEALIYWNEALQWPKLIAFETWKITNSNYITDRQTKENIKYAKLFAAMACVIPDNGYFLYADNNNDSPSDDHEHDYYDFYKTDLGKPVSKMIKIQKGAAYKKYQKGIIAYNRTEKKVSFFLSNNKKIELKPLEGLFIKGE